MKTKYAKTTYSRKLTLPCGCPEHKVAFEYAERFNKVGLGTLSVLIYQTMGKRKKLLKAKLLGDVLLYSDRAYALAEYMEDIGKRIRKYIREVKK